MINLSINILHTVHETKTPLKLLFNNVKIYHETGAVSILKCQNVLIKFISARFETHCCQISVNELNEEACGGVPEYCRVGWWGLWEGGWGEYCSALFMLAAL